MVADEFALLHHLFILQEDTTKHGRHSVGDLLRFELLVGLVQTLAHVHDCIGHPADVVLRKTRVLLYVASLLSFTLFMHISA